MSTRCTVSLTPRLHAYQDAYDDPPGMVWLEITSDGFTCDSGTGEVTIGMPIAEWDAAVAAYVAARAGTKAQSAVQAVRKESSCPHDWVPYVPFTGYQGCTRCGRVRHDDAVPGTIEREER